MVFDDVTKKQFAFERIEYDGIAIEGQYGLNIIFAYRLIF